MNNPQSHEQLLALFRSFRRSLNLGAVHRLKPLGIGPKQAAVMMCIRQYGPVPAVKLAEETWSDPAAITRVVEVLVENGLLAKKGNESDRRKWVIDLTAKGRQVVRRIAALQTQFSKQVFGKLAKREQSALMNVMGKLIKKAEG